MMQKNIAAAVEKAKKIKLVIFDVHGVLSNNDVLYDSQGNRIRQFCHEDGFGMNAMMLMGIEVAVITRKSKSVEARMADIGVKRFYQTKEKIAKYEELLKELNITDEEVCYVGDEVIDCGVMKRVGFAVAPSDAKKMAMEIADYVTEKAGGYGVARELAEFILEAQGKWQPFCEKVMAKGW
ncbi:MAG: HAD-IIIA family hydrolase [Firmicutes bacterium]|jgi:3-deoxy-D-manno-octulosonate 8-phosphate phosphatase (KDO 8-P phosphatase)|nr:HAD-IIIA family hydrolase [Bacillota bacterium]